MSSVMQYSRTTSPDRTMHLTKWYRISRCRTIPSFEAFVAILRHACESVYIRYGFGQVKSKNWTIFSACSICLQHTLAATYSAEQVESTTTVCFRDPHRIGTPLIKMTKPDMDCLVSPTANDASVYATFVKRVFVSAKRFSQYLV